MGKHEEVCDERDEVGKAGSPASNTENERAQEGKGDKPSVPKLKKDEVGGRESSGPLH